MPKQGNVEDGASAHTRIGDERREALLDAAYHLIAERGMEGLRLRDVAARASIHHATLHYYFPTKPDLIAALAERLATEFVATPAPGVPGQAELAEMPFRARLHGYLVNTEHQLRTAPERFIVTVEMILHGRRVPNGNALPPQDALWQDSLAAMFAEGQRHGQVREDLDVRAAARLLITFNYGLPLLMSSAPDALPAAIADFEEMLLAYVSPSRHAG